MVDSKGIDGSSLPPCHSALIEQIKRSNYLCSVWNYAFSSTSEMFEPNGNGWKLILDCGQQLKTNWFDGEMMPKNLEDIM